MDSTTMKLYRVKLKGLNNGIGTNYSTSYAVARNPTAAYDLVRHFMDQEDLGFDSDREMDTIELLAEETMYPLCETILFMEEHAGKENNPDATN